MPARSKTIPDPKPPIDIQEAAHLLGLGLTYVEIGARLGYRPSSVRRRLLEHGIRKPKPTSRRSGKWGDKLYSIWKKMRREARKGGTEVCHDWLSFDAFYDWARSSGFRPGLVLDRVARTRPFRPSNCRWRAAARGGSARAAAAPRKRLTEDQWRRAEKLHVEGGLSGTAVARRLGVTPGTILLGLERRGSLRPRPSGPTSTEEGAKLYSAWLRMHRRCNDPNDEAYAYYGGRGARVCRAWQEFEPFREWAVSAGWQPGLCLTRNGRTRVFSPTSCRWVTRAEAAKHAHHPSSRMPPRWTLTAFGETKGPTEWSRDRRCKVTLTALLQRVRNGWDPEGAIASPPQREGTGPPPKKLVRAFGVTKSVSDWSRDSRCKVTLVTLLRRLDRGLPAEEAISTPPYQARART